MSIAAILVGVFPIGAGVAAYLGRWRRWAFARPVFSYAIGFGVLYVGVGMVIFGVLTSRWFRTERAAQRGARGTKGAPTSA